MDTDFPPTAVPSEFFTVIAEAGTVLQVSVTVTDSPLPSLAAAVIFTVPAFLNVTFPAELTSATAVSLLLQLTFCSAFIGDTEAVS